MTGTTDYSVLIADDDERLRETLEEVLARRGYRVHATGSGLEALDIVERRPVDFGVFDFHMPDITGLELIQRIEVTFRRRNRAALPAILMTSDASEETRRRIDEVRIVRLVYKPLQMDRLLDALEAVTRQLFREPRPQD